MPSRERANQRTAQEIASHRVKYAGQGCGPVCKICGAATDSILLRCEKCQEKLFLVEELRHVGEWLRTHPEKIELATDKRKVIHLVVPRFADMAWCGVKVTQQKKDRKRELREKFPPGVCPDCLLAYEGLGI